jgi:pimeloyl-ACP methyl ester carboxylesterase
MASNLSEKCISRIYEECCWVGGLRAVCYIGYYCLSNCLKRVEGGRIVVDFDYVVMPAILLVVGVVVVWLSVRRLCLLPQKSYSKVRRVTERIVLSLAIFLVVAVAGSSVANAITLHRFRAQNSPPGTMYSINGHRMRIECSGIGSPTVVLDAGLGNDGFVWGVMQPQLSKVTRVCSYDRAGFGWSDALPPPRDADHIAGELHQLLSQAGVTGPIVLMGHSIAGVYIRDYATRYPADIAGMVFVDSATPLQDENPAMKSKGPPLWATTLLLRSALIAGVPRLLGMCSQTRPEFQGQARKLQAEDLCHVHYEAIAAETDSFNQSGHQTLHTGPYSSVPILVFSHDPAKLIPQNHPSKEIVEQQEAWSQMQEDLKRLSTRSRRIVARGSAHNVHLDRPDLVEREVSLFIEQIRGTVPQPMDYGSTVTK